VTFEVFACPALRPLFNKRTLPLLALGSLLESSALAAAASPALAGLVSDCLPCGFSPLRRLPDLRQPRTPGFTRPGLSCPRSVSHALRALLRLRSAGLVSCRSRPWGFLRLRSSPAAEPWDTSRSPLPSCGFPLVSSLSPSPLPARLGIRAPSDPGLHGSSPLFQGPCFRALLSVAVRLPGSAVTPPRGPRPRDGSPPQGLPKKLPWAFPLAHPLSSFPGSLSYEICPVAPQSLAAALSARPSRASPPLSRFITS
jgi:hypothetical protein